METKDIKLVMNQRKFSRKKAQRSQKGGGKVLFDLKLPESIDKLSQNSVWP